MNSSKNIEYLDAIEKEIRRRIEEIEESYHKERLILEKTLKLIFEAKRYAMEIVKRYGDEGAEPGALRSAKMPAGSRDQSPFTEMPWGRYASGVDKVLYVIKEAGTRGLGKWEVVDRIEEISGEKPALNSVTTWLYRGKKRGQLMNRRRKWYGN